MSVTKFPVAAIDQEGLRDVQRRYRNTERRLRRSGLAQKANEINASSQEILKDLSQHPAFNRIDVMRRYRMGIADLSGAAVLSGGILLLLRMSLQTFLPRVDFSLLLQTTLAVTFAIATVVALHVAFYDERSQQVAAPRGLRVGAAVCLVAGMVLFAAARMQVIGFSTASPEEMQAAERLARLFGGLAFIIGGLGLDLAGGLLGASGWANMIISSPLRNAYLCLDDLRSQYDVILAEVAALDEEIAAADAEAEPESTHKNADGGPGSIGVAQ